MREKKFRAWDKKEKRMIYAENWDTGAVINLDGQCGRTFWDLMQFTGLHDKNGVEIYEGDIVSIPYIDPGGRSHIEIESKRSKVGFENGQFVIYQTEPQGLVEWCEREKGEYVSNYGNLHIIKDKTILTVIGTIYENPELLNSKEGK